MAKSDEFLKSSAFKRYDFKFSMDAGYMTEWLRVLCNMGNIPANAVAKMDEVNMSNLRVETFKYIMANFDWIGASYGYETGLLEWARIYGKTTLDERSCSASTKP